MESSPTKPSPLTASQKQKQAMGWGRGSWNLISSFKKNLNWSFFTIGVFFFFTIGVLIYNVLLVSAVQQSQLYIYMYKYTLYSFSIYVIIEYWVEFPVLDSSLLLVIYFLCSSVYMSILILQFTPCLPFSPSVTVSLFSTSVTQFLLCK